RVGCIMATQSVACPKCKTALRTTRPATASEMFRCPRCGSPFRTAPAAIVAPITIPAPEPEPTPGMGTGTKVGLFLIPAALLAVVLGFGAVVAAYFITQSRPEQTPTPVVDHERERQLEEEKRRLAEQEQKLKEEQDKFAADKRRQEVKRLLADARRALDDKKYDAAQAAYEEAL